LQPGQNREAGYIADQDRLGFSSVYLSAALRKTLDKLSMDTAMIVFVFGLN
jgi:hypothetical protein